MEIKVFTTHQNDFDVELDHTNDLFCNDDDYDDPDFPYCDISGTEKIVIIVAIDGRNIAGGIQLSHHQNGWSSYDVDDNDKPKWSMVGIGVNEEYRNQGIARQLIEKQFEVMKELDIDYISQSSYTKNGAEYLYHVYEEYIAKTPHIRYINTKKLYGSLD